MLFGKKKKDEQFILSNARNLSEVTLPKDYFIAQYMSWMDDGVSIEKKIESYHSLKATFDTTDLDSFLDGIKTMDEGRQETPYPIFFTSQKEWQNFKETIPENEINEILCQSIAVTLKYFALLKGEHERFGRLSSMYFKISDSLNFDTVFSLSIDAYFFAIELKWKEICAANPQYNATKYYNQFYEFAKQDKVSIDNWQNFYFQAFTNVKDDFGGSNWVEHFVDIAEQANKKYSFIYDLIKNHNFSQYSAIYEITDFSTDELLRIASLYESGVLQGVYHKSNDPKYK